MTETGDILVRLPRQTAQRLLAFVELRGAGSEADIIDDALNALTLENEDDAQLALLIAQGFESEVWYNADDVRASIRARLAR